MTRDEVSAAIAALNAEPADRAFDAHAGESKIAHCKECEKALLAITRRNRRRRA